MPASSADRTAPPLVLTTRRRQRRAARSAALLAVAWAATGVLTGCSGAASPPATVTVTVTARAAGSAPAAGAAPATAATTSLDGLRACSVLTEAEAAAIVDAKLEAGVEGDPSEPSCEYDTEPTGPKTAQVRLVVGDGAEQTYRTDKRIGHVFTAVPGLGDEAWEEPFAIFVHKGGTWYGITVVLLEDQSVVVGPLRTAAAAIFPRVP